MAAIASPAAMTILPQGAECTGPSHESRLPKALRGVMSERCRDSHSVRLTAALGSVSSSRILGDVSGGATAAPRRIIAGRLR